MPDESDTNDFSPAEITAMKYAYRQLLGEHPARFRDLKDKQQLALSVIKSLEHIKAAPAKDVASMVRLIMDEED